MPVIDTEGRLFGRLNLVDAAIGGFVVLLVPLAVAAVYLFRAPTPVITSVEMVPLSNIEERSAQGTALGGKLKVRGSGLRPILRVEIGGHAAIAFVFESPASADVLFGELPAGTHDLVLFDGVQEVARANGAVVIPEKPTTGTARVRAVGTFIDMPEAIATSLRQGAKLPNDRDPDVEILALGDVHPARVTINDNNELGIPNRVQRAGVVAVRCQLMGQLSECRVGGTLLDAGNVLPMPGSAGAIRMLIEEVQPDSEPAKSELRVRFIGYGSVINLLKPGDSDREQWALDGRGATIVSLGDRRSLSGAVVVGLMQQGGRVSSEVQATDQLVSVDAVLTIGLDRARTGWRYRTDAIRAGGPLTFMTPAYVVHGVVLSMTPGSTASPSTGR